ncbi:MAG: peptidoglycan editing factor PgeF [Candidatus Promineifilaceae bacterium]|nr:peptidoglycan editing factor PgeF [Candidatus Promineifilaceae bacterium]
MLTHDLSAPIPTLHFANLPRNGRISHAVFTRLGGVSPTPFASLNLSVSVADAEGNVMANRARAYGVHGRGTDELVHAHLIHGAEVATVTQADNGRYVGPVDGLVTDAPGCGLTMNYADCAPILLYDPVRTAIGLGHAGWQGVIKDLPGALVGAMVEAFGSHPADLVAAVGPCIGPCCYEVDEPVVSAARAAFPTVGGALVPQPDGPRPHFDLPRAARLRLRAAGVSRIEEAGLCTACRTDLFFSHRAEGGATGRFGALLLLNG